MGCEMSLKWSRSISDCFFDEKSNFLADAIFGTHKKVGVRPVESVVRAR